MAFWKRALKEAAPLLVASLLNFLRGLLQGRNAKEEAKELGEGVLEAAEVAIEKVSTDEETE